MPRFTLYQEDDKAATSEQLSAALVGRDDVQVIAQRPRLLLVEGNDSAFEGLPNLLQGWLISAEQTATHPKPQRPKVKPRLM
jgi:hypothetical protein